MCWVLGGRCWIRSAFYGMCSSLCVDTRPGWGGAPAKGLGNGQWCWSRLTGTGEPLLHRFRGLGRPWNYGLWSLRGVWVGVAARSPRQPRARVGVVVYCCTESQRGCGRLRRTRVRRTTLSKSLSTTVRPVLSRRKGKKYCQTRRNKQICGCEYEKRKVQPDSWMCVCDCMHVDALIN